MLTPKQLAREASEIGLEMRLARSATPAWNTPDVVPISQHRTVYLTPASSIRPRPVRWLWDGRAALGTLVLVGGREGIGKSICVYTLAADVTRGRLQGAYFRVPKAVVVAAMEDSWEHTIVPRLMAGGADLSQVYRVDVATGEAIDTALTLPRDLAGLEKAILDVGAVLVILDPLLSRLDTALDSHKDAEVRIALEPLVALGDRTSATIAGLIHVNKSTSSDPLTTLMASRAFAAVARSVLFVMSDPDDESVRLLGMAKNNLGKTDLPTLAFRIVGEKVAETAEGPVWTGKLQWTGETSRTIRDALQATAEASGDRTALAEASDWLADYLHSQGGTCDSAIVKKQGSSAGHSSDALKRARRHLQIAATSQGFPRRTIWSLPQSEQSVGASPGETLITTLTAPTEDQQAQSVQSEQLEQTPTWGAPTGTDGRPFVFNPKGAY